VVDVGNDRDIANLGAFGFAAHGACVLKGFGVLASARLTPRRAFLNPWAGGSGMEMLPWLDRDRNSCG